MLHLKKITYYRIMITAIAIVLIIRSAVFTEAAAQVRGKPTRQEKPVSNPTTGAAYQALLQQIAHIAQVSKGEVGVAAIDLRTGSRVEFKANDEVSLASTFKVPLAAYAMHLAEQGKLSLSEPIHVRREDMIEPGVLYDHFRHTGTMISILNAIELSVSISDNSATDIVFRSVGGPAGVNAWLRQRGHPHINVGTKILKDRFAGPDSSKSPSVLVDTSVLLSPTPLAVVNFLADLHQGRIINATNTALLLDIMSRTVGDRISAQLPPGVKVLHKTGTIIGSHATVNDIGYIQMPDGGWVAIAVYIKQSPLTVSHSTRDKVIGGISRSIYDYFVLTSVQ
jgi:beta-lactamase class A